jgi:hypothetical protein
VVSLNFGFRLFLASVAPKQACIFSELAFIRASNSFLAGFHYGHQLMVCFCLGLMGIDAGGSDIQLGHHLGLERFQDGYQMFHHLLRHLFHFCRLTI